MMTQPETLHAELAALVGAAHVRPATPADAVDGRQPRYVVAPGSAQEVAQVLRFANQAGLRVAPRGGGSKLDWGQPPAALDLILTTERLDAVLEHAWADMTATVQAGCRVAVLQQALAQHSQRLALDALWPERATVGGILATNDSGALRLRFGALRDLILGVLVALPDGTLARSGGKVVKNVAGYDLQKLMTGALGTLGVIVEATFRLYPLPAAQRTFSLALPTPALAQRLVLAILDSTLVPSSLQLRLSAAAAPEVDVRFEGIAAAIDSQADHLRRIAAELDVPAPVEADEQVWLAREALWQAPEGAIVKVSVLPADWATFVAALERVAQRLRLHWTLVAQAIGLGVLQLRAPNDEALLAGLSLLRAEAAQRGGALVALRLPTALKARFDVWGPVGDALALQRRIKQQFDPRGTLNPGRFVGGI